MKRILVFSDFDGVVTTPRKIYECPGVVASVHKEFSDHDAFAIEMLGRDLIFVSRDPRNVMLAHHKKVQFIHAPDGKMDAIRRYWKSNIDAKGNSMGLEAQSEPCFIYVGDSPLDYECLMAAVRGFVPADASRWLLKKLIKNNHLSYHRHLNPEPPQIINRVQVLNSNGGGDCLEEMLLKLYDDPIFKDYSASFIDNLRRFIES